MSIQVKSIDTFKAEDEVKKCPLIVRQYVKALESALRSQQDLTRTAIGKIRELSKALKEK